MSMDLEEKVKEAIGMAQGQINGLVDFGFVQTRRPEEVKAALVKAADGACQECAIELYSDEYDRVISALRLQNRISEHL